MTNQTQLEEIAISIEQARESVNNMEALQRLTKNRDFIDIILKGYFEKEASRLVLLKGDPSCAGDVEQAAIDKQIIGIGMVRQYFGTIMQLGRMSAQSITDYEETREELLAEDLKGVGE